MSLDLDGIEAEYVENAINKREVDTNVQEMIDETLNVIDNTFHPSSKQRKLTHFLINTLVKSALLSEDLKRGVH